MIVNEEFFQKHKEKKTELNVFINGGGVKATMLSGRITAHDSTSFVLDECLIQIDKLISVTPKH